MKVTLARGEDYDGDHEAHDVGHEAHDGGDDAQAKLDSHPSKIDSWGERDWKGGKQVEVSN